MEIEHDQGGSEFVDDDDPFSETVVVCEGLLDSDALLEDLLADLLLDVLRIYAEG